MANKISSSSSRWRCRHSGHPRPLDACSLDRHYPLCDLLQKKSTINQWSNYRGARGGLAHLKDLAAPAKHLFLGWFKGACKRPPEIAIPIIYRCFIAICKCFLYWNCSRKTFWSPEMWLLEGPLGLKEKTRTARYGNDFHTLYNIQQFMTEITLIRSRRALMNLFFVRPTAETSRFRVRNTLQLSVMNPMSFCLKRTKRRLTVCEPTNALIMKLQQLLVYTSEHKSSAFCAWHKSHNPLHFKLKAQNKHKT